MTASGCTGVSLLCFLGMDLGGVGVLVGPYGFGRDLSTCFC